MGRTCVAPGCTAGYKSNGDQKMKVSIYRFKPHWKKHNPRSNWSPTKNSGLCKRHFVPTDYTYERFNDSNKTRPKRLGNVSKPRLKPYAMPTICPNCPPYISKKKPNERSQNVTSASREKHVDEHQERIGSEKLEKDKVKTLEELFEKIVKNSDLDKCDVTIVQKENKLMFIGFPLSNIDQLITEYCVVIYNDLSFNLRLKDVCVNEKGLRLCKDGKVTCCNNAISFYIYVEVYVFQFSG